MRNSYSRPRVSGDFNTDFARICRFLTGQAIGLVLGGGGAKGAAHLGVIQAIRDAGIPIDMTGGTSMGSMVSGLLAAKGLLPKVKAKKTLWSSLKDKLKVIKIRVSINIKI